MDNVSAKHDKIHYRATIVQYIVLFIVIVSYSIYGYYRYTNSRTHPLTKTYETNTGAYPLPESMRCVPLNSTHTFFDIDQIIYWDTNLDQNNSTTNCVSSNSKGLIKEMITNNDNQCILLKGITLKFPQAVTTYSEQSYWTHQCLSNPHHIIICCWCFICFCLVVCWYLCWFTMV